MIEPEGKRVRDSYTEHVHVVETEHMNQIQTLFGGQLMSWMDVIAGAAGSKYCGKGVTVVAVDEMQITAPAKLGDTLVYRARVTNVGRTSLEIFIEVDIEDAEKNLKRISEAYFLTVALDEHGRPSPVPPLIIETTEEQSLWEAAERRKEQRNSRRAQQS
ncbi:MAG: acyl-CoA thioesterase [Peptococcaceae bacterium]|jgi:acyl-CoA hydrolase|nr:acyl-CoA thioesterase [Peptococcaceae bacterium]